ncbi:MAG: hypothetical protein SCG80_02340 [Nitrosomonadaceae bacterium]|jgi:hypothetical protein|nr:hypothetical protein [Nitrosomonadaceae bacterium]
MQQNRTGTEANRLISIATQPIVLLVSNQQSALSFAFDICARIAIGSIRESGLDRDE